MSAQEVVNVLMGLVSFFGGWMLKEIWGNLKALQEVDHGLSGQLNRIEVMIAGDYVKKDEMEKSLNMILSKLDRIEEKLDKKVDKGH